MHTLRVVISIPLASVVCLITSNLVARLFIAQSDDFDRFSDLPLFLDRTRLFAIGLLLPAIAFAFLLFNARILNRIWVGVLLGGAAGLGWTLLNGATFGPSFGAWGFNVLYCWVAGGTVGLLAVALLGYSRRALP